jgi:hypothetical protein
LCTSTAQHSTAPAAAAPGSAQGVKGFQAAAAFKALPGIIHLRGTAPHKKDHIKEEHRG